jgi:hypothetical protein
MASPSRAALFFSLVGSTFMMGLRPKPPAFGRVRSARERRIAEAEFLLRLT